MKRDEILCLVVLLGLIILGLPLVIAADSGVVTIINPVLWGNFSTSMNISVNHGVSNATSMNCKYNLSGGTAGAGLVVLDNINNLTNMYAVGSNYSVFENATLNVGTYNINDSRTVNISCSVFNTSGMYNSSGVVNVTLDRTPPNVTWTWPSAGWNRSGVIQINVTINDTMYIFTNISVNITTSSGTQQTLLNLTNQTAGGKLYNITFNTAGLSDGGYNLSVVVRDQAGNVNFTQIINYLKFDNANPSISIAKSNSTTTSLGLQVTVDDTTSGVNETCTLSRSGATISGTSSTQYVTESSLDCSTTYKYTATCKDQTGNSATSTESSFQTSSCGGNSAAGGGGGTTTPTWSNTYVVADEQFATGYNRQMATNHRAEIKVGTSKHYVGIKSVTASEVTIEISSDPIQVKLGVGEDAKADVDNDGTYDVYVKLNAITNNKADLTIQKISEEVAKAGDVVTTSGEVTTPGSEGATPETGKKGVSSKVWIIIGIIALVVIIGAGVAVKRKS